ncbi:MAG: SDR family oxidoreductase [Synergistaceae bacterium]|jgi:UDP-N-acetylglucosamine 4-epimerase|nr:SDR family oxidoreductase [Synergistaceae bacterium]
MNGRSEETNMREKSHDAFIANAAAGKAGKKYRWLVTGAAGFIGSHLVEALLSIGQAVVGLDNFSSGFERNVEAVQTQMSEGAHFEFIRGDIRDKKLCDSACEGIDFILHHAAFVSVPASVANPTAAHANNVEGFFNVLQAAKKRNARRLIYASSSAVYGNEPNLPLREEAAAANDVLSPYAVTKRIDEFYAETWGSIYGLECVGLRYFNVFGPRQDPNGPYAAVIPRWLYALERDLPVTIYGDGENTRDFCYVKNVAQANILAATVENRQAVGKVYNIACGESVTLNELFELLKRKVAPDSKCSLVHEAPRAGDITHSAASIQRARSLLGYTPFYSLEAGLAEMYDKTRKWEARY